MRKSIVEVVKTVYDGFYLTKDSKGLVCSYEGIGLCPASVKKYIADHEVREINCTWMEAVSYGYI